jgi:hypothetical protein
MKLPPGVSILISNDINTLTEKELLFLNLGGNKKLYEFILTQCPSLINLPRKFLYISPIIEYYRKRLEYLVDSLYSIKERLFKTKLNNNNLMIFHFQSQNLIQMKKMKNITLLI